jgi:PBP1b-binding outer membrane lipoprotein LpoB
VLLVGGDAMFIVFFLSQCVESFDNMLHNFKAAFDVTDLTILVEAMIDAHLAKANQLQIESAKPRWRLVSFL